jgi:hypothetical protein
MAFQHQHKRSSEKNRRPRPVDLIDGQIAVNYNPDTPGVFFKDSNGGLVKAGPVHIGPVEVPGNFAQYSVGELAYDPATGLLQVWTGSAWNGIANSAYVTGVGADGKSAYDLALDNGFVGTEAEWVNLFVQKPELDEVNADVVALNTALGISEDDVTFGTFTSPHLADNQNLKYVLEGIGTTISNRITAVDDSLALKAPLADPALTGVPTAPTAAADTSTTQIATTEFVSEAVAALVDSAPGTLDTLNEIAAAINDDAAVFTTLTADIAAVQADVDQNEADADAAMVAEVARVDNLMATGMWLYANQASFPAAADNHGRIVHSHADGSMYYAHGGSWHKIESEAEAEAARLVIQNDVDQNESDSDATNNAIFGRLLTLEADPTTGTAVAAVQADVDQNEADADAAIAELNTDVTDLNTALGITENDQDLGTFTGSTIADNASVKAALQTLETTLEAVDIDTDDLAALTGIAENVTNLGTFTGSTISDNLAVKAALQELETAQEATQADVDQNESDADSAISGLDTRIAAFELDPGPPGAVFSETDANVDDLITLSGVAENSADLGTFTGTTISDNTTVKAALQEVETALEGHIPVLIEVHNQTGGDLTKGDVVYVNGTHSSGKPTVALADSNGSGTYPALGLIYATVADGVDGLVVISGTLSGIDTDTPAWDAGQALYVSETAGEMTTTRPTASGTKVQKVAMTSRRHQSSGSVVVIGAGRTNDVPNELTALTGVALNATDLGTFTGATISDNTTVKTALQELEAAHESLPRMLHASWDASTAGSFDDANDVIASRGIASVVRSAAGIFRVTFTTAFADANYTVTCGVGSTDYSGSSASPREVSVLERNAAYVDVICERSDDAVNEDNEYMSLIVML